PRDARGNAARESVRDYFAAVSGVDHHFGRLLQALEESGAAENTIVVFTADHGEMMGSHGRMQKGVVYEESFRVPFLIRYPGQLRPGTDSLHLNVTDIMPTLLGLMGLRDRIPAQVEGTDYSHALRTGGGQRPASTFFLTGLGSPDRGVRGVRTDRYTFTVGAAGSGPVILFDRQNDPYQLENVAPAHPEVCRQLLDELNRWLVKTNDPWKRLPWPIIPKGAFPVRRHAGGFTVDFEEDPAADLWAATSSAFAALTEKTDEVLGGKRSLKCDTTASGERFHEFLRLHDLLLPNKEYEVTYRYRVLAASEETRFYTVVRS
ncbi:MAG: sulfatase-like hydrolase/transferase, partial [Armatimonadota bacterium]|nr:sulfatase-like hydrolase/transferase [Armatimonadota bacterium]